MVQYVMICASASITYLKKDLNNDINIGCIMRQRSYLAISIVILLLFSFLPMTSTVAGADYSFDVTTQIDEDGDGTFTDTTSGTVKQDEKLEIKFRVENTGDLEDKFEISTVTQKGGAPNYEKTSGKITLLGGATGFLYMNVTPTDSDSPSNYWYNVTIHSVNGDENLSQNLTITVQEAFNYIYEIQVSLVSSGDSSVEVEELKDYKFKVTVKNTGNTPDRYGIEAVDFDSDLVSVSIDPPIFPPGSTSTIGPDNETDINVTVTGNKEGSGSITINVSSFNSDAFEDLTFQFTVTKAEEDGESESLMDMEIFGLPFIAVVAIIFIIPILLVVIVSKKKGKKKKKKDDGTAAVAPAMAGGAVAAPAAAPQTTHCPRCGGVIEIPAPPRPPTIQCVACGSVYNTPGGTGVAAPAAAPAVQQPAAAPAQATNCPRCGSQIVVPGGMRPVNVQCPGCASTYTIN